MFKASEKVDRIRSLEWQLCSAAFSLHRELGRLPSTSGGGDIMSARAMFDRELVDDIQLQRERNMGAFLRTWDRPKKVKVEELHRQSDFNPFLAVGRGIGF